MTTAVTDGATTAHAIAWSGGTHLLRQGLQLATFIVLARILSPAEFGLLAMTAAVLGLVTILVDGGLGAALVQARELTTDLTATVFWCAAGLGAACAAALHLLAPAVAAFYREPALVPVVQLMTLSVFIGSLVCVPAALLQRDLRTKAMGSAELAGLTVGSAVAITLAAHGHGVWSLAWQVVATAATTALVMYRLTAWRPRLTFSRSAAVRALRYGGGLAGFNICNYAVRNLDDVLVGRFFGVAAVGLYTRAYSLLLMPVTAVTAVFGRVLVPVMARLQDRQQDARTAYLRGLQAVAFCTFPMMLGLLVVADDFVAVVFGTGWLGLVPLIRVFALLALAQAVGSTTGWIFQSQGRTDQLLRWGLASSPVLVGSFVVGVWLGSPERVAASYAFTSGILLFYPAFAYPGRLMGLRVRAVLATLWPIAACAAVMAMLVALLGLGLPVGWSAAARLTVLVPSGVVAYLALALATRSEALALVAAGVRAVGTASSMSAVDPASRRAAHELA